jgi:hypothetical protein
LHCPVTGNTLGPNIFFSTLLSKPLSFYRNTKGQVSHPYRKQAKLSSPLYFHKSICISCPFTYGTCPRRDIFLGLIAPSILFRLVVLTSSTYSQ